MNPGRVNACMIKTFNRMKKRIGFLIYQFVLPAIQVCTEIFFYFIRLSKELISSTLYNDKLFSISFSQVSLFCLAIGQDPKDLSVGIVNGENPGVLGCSNGKNLALIPT